MKRVYGILSAFVLMTTLQGAPGFAETIDVPDQQDCPGGNDGWLRGIEVNVTTGVVVTHCTRVEVIILEPATPPPSSTDPSSPSPTPVSQPETVTRVIGSDPYPSLVTGDEIPGTRRWSTDETSWNEFYVNSIWAGWRCPTIYGPDGSPYAGENNGFDDSSNKWFRVCIKNPWREPISPVVQSNFEIEKASAQAAALLLSVEWNNAHPGQQKCFEWGPLSPPSGGTESGGICANPVGILDSATSIISPDTSTPILSSDTSTVVSMGPLAEVSVVSGAVVPMETSTVVPMETSTVVPMETSTVVPMETLAVTTYQSLDTKLLGDVFIKSVSAKVTLIAIDLESTRETVQVLATKKGSPTLKQTVVTNSQGNKTVKFFRNLTGYTITIKVDGEVVDRAKA